MLVLTCVDGALRAAANGSCLEVRETLQNLSARGVSTILTSHHEADELFRMHERLIQSPRAARSTNALPPVRAMPARDNVYVAPAVSGGHRLARTPSRSRARCMLFRP